MIPPLHALRLSLLMGCLTSVAHAVVQPVARQYAEAEQAFQSGELQRAQQLYTAIVDTRGDEPMAWFRIGLIQQKQHAFNAALTAYDNAATAAEVDHSSSYKQLLAKIHFNRALLLLESADADLKEIAPGALAPGREVIRDALFEHVNSALLAAGSDGAVDASRTVAAGNTSAKGYVYEAKTVIQPPPEKKTP